MYFHLLEGQRVTGSDTKKKIDLGDAEPPQENSNAKSQMAVMDGFGFPLSTDVFRARNQVLAHNKSSYGISSFCSPVET